MASPASLAFMRALAYGSCLPRTREVTRPGALLPRVARPTLRTYSMPSRGKSKRTTCCTCGKSMPRDARSVQMSKRGGSWTEVGSRTNRASVSLRPKASIAPWKQETVKRSARRSRRRSAFSTRRHDSMVLQKMIVCSTGSSSSSSSSEATLISKPASLPVGADGRGLSRASPLPDEQSSSFCLTPERVRCRAGPLMNLARGKSRSMACCTCGGSVAVTKVYAARGGILCRICSHAASKSLSS
mmetsp:Transcript_2218/g.4977  ORF Transcript_2218/g.4977 Transcript_2218/m.4977 type:complete len:243 (+) Transcript_2218:387-1115(+)